MRQRMDDLPIIIGSDFAVGHFHDQLVTLNRDPVVVEGQRFDGVVVHAPATAATFAWAFASPENISRWYILRERGDMKGFGDFLRRPRQSLASAAKLQPEGVATVFLQKLDASAWVAGERYVLWFRFQDDQPVEITLRAGFFPTKSLSNARLPALLFPE